MASSFAYGAFTLSGWSSQDHSAGFVQSRLQSEPRCARTPVWALSISLAATFEITVVFFSSGYLDVSVHRVPEHTLWIHVCTTKVCLARFPHSEIHGSGLICSSPWLFAACYVLRRQSVPWHPPCALISLIFMINACRLVYHCFAFCYFSYLLLCAVVKVLFTSSWKLVG